jgi:hypothetical protein
MNTTNESSVPPYAAAAATVSLADGLIGDYPAEGRRLLRVAADLYLKAGMNAEAARCLATEKQVRAATRVRHRPGLG